VLCDAVLTAETPFLTWLLCQIWLVFGSRRLIWLAAAQVGDMAALLRARSRWVVTGTPMGNGGLRDLHGLLRVLRHDPFSDRRLWRTCVEHPCLRGMSVSCDIADQSSVKGLDWSQVVQPGCAMSLSRALPTLLCISSLRKLLGSLICCTVSLSLGLANSFLAGALKIGWNCMES
jgi:hypothetical protein